MISFLMMAVNAVAGIFVSVLKAFFSMLAWFFKSFFKALKLSFCVLPITTIGFFLLLCVNIFLLFGGSMGFLSLGAGNSPKIELPHSIEFPGKDTKIPEQVIENTDKAFTQNSYVVSRMYNELISWWESTVSPYRGSVTYIFLMVLTFIMVIPVSVILISISVFLSFGKLIFICIAADAVIYVLRMLLGKGFLAQASERYYRLFPEAGKRHYEKDYEKWLRGRKYEDTPERDDSFYDYERGYSDEDYENDDYYEDDDTGDEDEYNDYYEDYDIDDDEDSENEYAYDDDDSYEDDFERKNEDYYKYDYNSGNNNYRDTYKNKNSNSGNSNGVFDFFAGCNSRESVDRKYKSLVKLYHPDNMDGDTAALQEINMQYEKAKKKFP